MALCTSIDKTWKYASSMTTYVKIHAVQSKQCFGIFSAWIHGDPRKVVYPTDSHGQFCGQKNSPNA